MSDIKESAESVVEIGQRNGCFLVYVAGVEVSDAGALHSEAVRQAQIEAHRIATAARIAVEYIDARADREGARAVEVVEVMAGRPVAGEWAIGPVGTRIRRVGDRTVITADSDDGWCVHTGKVADGSIDFADMWSSQTAADAWARANPHLLDWQMPRASEPAHRPDECRCGQPLAPGSRCTVCGVTREPAPASTGGVSGVGPIVDCPVCSTRHGMYAGCPVRALWPVAAPPPPPTGEGEGVVVCSRCQRGEWCPDANPAVEPSGEVTDRGARDAIAWLRGNPPYLMTTADVIDTIERLAREGAAVTTDRDALRVEMGAWRVERDTLRARVTELEDAPIAGRLAKALGQLRSYVTAHCGDWYIDTDRRGIISAVDSALSEFAALPARAPEESPAPIGALTEAEIDRCSAAACVAITPDVGGRKPCLECLDAGRAYAATGTPNPPRDAYWRDAFDKARATLRPVHPSNNSGNVPQKVK